MDANARYEREGSPYGGLHALHATGGDERLFFTENKVAIMFFDPAVTCDLGTSKCTDVASTDAVMVTLFAVWSKLREATKHLLASEYCEGAR